MRMGKPLCFAAMREKTTAAPLPAPLVEGWTVPPEFASKLGETAKALRAPAVLQILAAGRERVELVRAAFPEGARECVVKTFPRQCALKRFFAARTGTKAQRAFRAARILRERGVGTPEPLALFEDAPRGESRLFTAFVPGLTDFRRELARLLAGTGVADPATELSALMQTVADACRAFHDCGIVHRDLGNQNIGLKKTPEGTWEVFFLDLDRVRIFPAGTLSWEQRGRDLARLHLPSELRWFFCHMYAGSCPQPDGFRRGVEKGMAAWNFHCRTRFLRHPVQEFSRRVPHRAPRAETPFEGRGLWLWDEKTAQALIVHDKKNSRKLRPLSNVFRIAREVLARGLALRRNFAEADALSFCAPAAFAGTFGMTLEATFEQDWETQLRFLGELEEAARERLPVLLRVYRHKGRAQWDFAAEKARELHARGNGVALALVQDRAAVRDPESWREMVLSTVEKTRAFADFYEVGHATNRGKWGVWDFRDYARLLAPALEAKRKYPELRLTGPACIDFDLHSLPGLLSVVPAGTFHALSQHLYVDRRGAPENFQGKFDLARKCAIHRAFAKTYGFSEEKIIVSEVNWPLLGAGTHSPCSAFYCGRGDADGARSAPHVSEEEYAKFLCRYVLLAVASGHVSRVYWWRLVHRGFGLVDDADAENPRARPAFSALKTLLAQLAGARFERRLDDVPAGTFALEFSRPDASRFILRWTRETFPKLEEIRSENG